MDLKPRHARGFPSRLEIRRPPTEAAYTSLTAARHWSVNTLGFEVITKAAPYGSTCLPLVGPCLITALSKAQSTRPGRLFLHHTKRDVHATANTPRCACGRSYTGPKKRGDGQRGHGLAH